VADPRGAGDGQGRAVLSTAPTGYWSALCGRGAPASIRRRPCGDGWPVTAGTFAFLAAVHSRTFRGWRRARCIFCIDLISCLLLRATFAVSPPPGLNHFVPSSSSSWLVTFFHAWNPAFLFLLP